MRARIRTIKPEVFLDERLWDLGVETGLPVLQAFAGLWCYADREGRFEWRPRALQTVILPYWRGDFAALLDALAGWGFIVAYEVGGRRYGLVRNFKRHQTPNTREPASELPAPPDTARDTPPDTDAHVHARAEHAHASWEGKGSGTGTGTGRELEGEREGAPPAPPTTPPRQLSYFVPEDWVPKDRHRARCRELRRDLDEVVKRFRKTEFKRAYSDWDLRFDLWLDDEQAQARSASSGELDTTGAATAFRPNWEHRDYAAEHLPGKNLDLLAFDCRQSKRFESRSGPERDREFMVRLKHLAATGSWIPDGPLPRTKVNAKEAAA